jgi:hypothetical protein
MENAERWIRHSVMSNTGPYDAAVAAMPLDVSALNSIVQGIIIHTDWFASYGVSESDFARVSRDTLPVADRFALALERDARPLTDGRPPARRTVGTCRDFALVLCGLLRSKGISARLRCGFADYFGDGWEDHWVCEYWDRDKGRWRLSDAQLDGAIREKCKIDFDPADVPRDRFLAAGEAWAACRKRRRDPNQFGHGAVKGLWFMKVNVVRDHFVVNNRETSDWDRWREAAQSKHIVSKMECALLDLIAAHPEQPMLEVAPDWLL